MQTVKAGHEAPGASELLLRHRSPLRTRWAFETLARTRMPETGEFLLDDEGMPISKGSSILVRWAEVEYLDFFEV
jgi:hypothetical protein